jgi:hypothetical protein
MNYIAPIQTEWKGYRFRSRTEARWAVFFDSLSVSFQYEPEGFELDDGIKYLPDFFLPQWNVWFEVKGVDPTDLEIKKAGLLAALTEKSVLMAVGAPDYGILEQVIWFPVCLACRWREDEVRVPFYGDSWGYRPIQFKFRATNSGKLTIYNEYFDFGWDRPTDDGGRPIPANAGAVESAYAAARGARFEHGESP